jgi:hypothetical protein
LWGTVDEIVRFDLTVVNLVRNVRECFPVLVHLLLVSVASCMLLADLSLE